MNAEFFAAVEDIEKEKGIPRDYMYEKIEQAMLAAFRRDNNSNPVGINGGAGGDILERGRHVVIPFRLCADGDTNALALVQPVHLQGQAVVVSELVEDR